MTENTHIALLNDTPVNSEQVAGWLQTLGYPLWAELMCHKAFFARLNDTPMEQWPRLLLIYWKNKEETADIVTLLQSMYHIPSIIVSDTMAPELLQTMLTANPAGMLYAPFSQEQLGFTISMAFARERNRQQEKENAYHYHSLSGLLSDVYYEADMEGKIQKISPAVKQLLGYDSQELIDTYSGNLYRDLSMRHAIMDELRRNGSCRNFHAQFKRKDGRVVYVEMDINLKYDNSRNPNGSYGILRDVNGLYENMHSISESRKEYKDIFDAFSDIYFEATTSGILTKISSSAFRITGYKLEELVGQSTSIFFRNQGKQDAFYKELLETGYIHNHETELSTRFGQVLKIQLSCRLKYNAANEVLGISGVLRDMTERLEMYNRIVEKERDLNLAQEISKVGSFKLDIRKLNIEVSNQILKICELDLHDRFFDTQTFIDLIHPEDLMMFRDKLKNVWNIHRMKDFQFKIVTGSDTVKYLNLKINPPENGKVKGIIQDISESEKARILLKKVNNSLSDVALEDYFEEVTKLLCEELEAGYVFVGELHEGSVRTLSFFSSRDGYLPTYHYPMKDTFCEAILQEGRSMRDHHVQDLFPADEDLKTYGIQAYTGFRLQGTDNETIGILAILFDTPIVKATGILQLSELIIKRTETELRGYLWKRRLEYNQSLLLEAENTAQMAYYEWDTDTDYIQVSENFYRIFENRNYKGILPIKTMMECVFPEDRERVYTAMTTISKNDWNDVLEYRIITPNGHLKWIVCRGAGAIKKSTHLLRVVQDITESKNIQKELGKLQSLIENTNELIMITNEQKVIEYVNPAFKKITGYAREELIGKTPKLFNSGILSDRFFENMYRQLYEGHSFEDIFINKKKNGKLIYLFQTITPIMQNGKPTYFISIAKDYSERLKSRRRIELLNYHIHRQAEDTKNAVMHNFINGQEDERIRISREIHDGLCQILSMAKVSLAPKSTKPFEEKITLANELIDTSIIEAKRIASNLSPTVLQDYGLIAGIRKLCNTIGVNTSVKVHLKIFGEYSRLDSVVELSLYRIVQEVLNNALQHSNCNKINVVVACWPEVLKIKVVDNGDGIELPQEEPVQRKLSGNGLLNIRERARLINAQLKILTSKHKYTAVKIEIPIINN